MCRLCVCVCVCVCVWLWKAHRITHFLLQPVRLRRSAMFVPGSNDRAVAKAPSLSVDAVILDLEDAVAPAAKGEARDKVTQAVLQHTASHPELGIRINPLSTQYVAFSHAHTQTQTYTDAHVHTGPVSY